jgi:hypothetical protein
MIMVGLFTVPESQLLSNPGQFSEVMAVIAEYGGGSFQMTLNLFTLASLEYSDRLKTTYESSGYSGAFESPNA